jgi:hypothetical protein
MNVPFAPDVATAAGVPPVAATAGVPPAGAAVPPAGATGAAFPPPGGGGAGGASWENLNDGADHLRHEIGPALWLNNGDTTDQQVVAPCLTLQEWAADADLPTQLREWVDDPDVKYYLVVIGKRVEVLHQLRACHATAGHGQSILGLHPRWTISRLCLPATPRWNSCRPLKPRTMYLHKSWGMEARGGPSKCCVSLLERKDAA